MQRSVQLLQLHRARRSGLQSDRQSDRVLHEELLRTSMQTFIKKTKKTSLQWKEEGCPFFGQRRLTLGFFFFGKIVSSHQTPSWCVLGLSIFPRNLSLVNSLHLKRSNRERVVAESFQPVYEPNQQKPETLVLVQDRRFLTVPA